MRYLKILKLNFEKVFEHRARSFVWFTLSVINPLIMILFWKGAKLNANSNITNKWNISSISAYYILLIIASSILISHIEESVAYYDIRKGELSNYLLRPISYYWIKLTEETPYRILQGIFGIITFFIFTFFLGKLVSFHQSNLFLNIIIAINSFFISFTFKISMALLAFWFINISGIFNTFEVVKAVFSGIILPLELMPEILKNIAFITPFPYAIYYPIIAFQGKLTSLQSTKIIGIQFFWIFILALTYKFLWKKGIKKFTAVGQ